MIARGLGIKAMRLLAAGGMAAALAVSAFPASAGPTADAAEEAETMLATDPAGALAAFERAEAAFWAASPLQFRKVIFARDVKGFGQYTPRPDGAFKPGERATIYLEPFGYGFTENGGEIGVALATDVQIRTPGGLILAKAEDFAELAWSGREKSREVHATIAVDLPALKPGDYELVLTLRDKGSPKTATATLPFSVAAP
jgi:hypothetical protein